MNAVSSQPPTARITAGPRRLNLVVGCAHGAQAVAPLALTSASLPLPRGESAS